jgi:hypothetical protein
MASKTNSLHFSACFLIFIFILLFIAVPVSAKVEDHIVKTESGFYYTVQKGDTLWDLSNQFKDSPWEWPGLWSNNPQIPNPHLIYPGQKLLIFKKTCKDGKNEEVLEPVAMPDYPLPRSLIQKKILFFSWNNKAGFIRDEEISPVGISKSMFDYKALSQPVTFICYPSSIPTPWLLATNT